MRFTTLFLSIPALDGLVSAAAIPPQETGITSSFLESAVNFLEGFEEDAQTFLDSFDNYENADPSFNDLLQVESQTIEQAKHLLSGATSGEDCTTLVNLWDNLSQNAITAAPLLEKIGNIAGLRDAPGPNGNSTYRADFFDKLTYLANTFNRDSESEITPLLSGLRGHCSDGDLVKTIDETASSALEALGRVVDGWNLE